MQHLPEGTPKDPEGPRFAGEVVKFNKLILV